MHDFAYTRPTTLEAARALLAADADAIALSGGQTLMPVLRARLSAPSQLVDLSRLAELKGIARDGDQLVIGAGETHANIAASPIVDQALPALAALAGKIGDPMVRHRGMIGGSIANNDPAACYTSAALALDAVVVTDRRAIPARDFFVAMFTTALEPGELVTALSFPACARATYVKFPNPASRFALIGVFVALLGPSARIGVTGAGAGVFRWSKGEAHLDGGSTVGALSEVALDANRFTSDIHGSSAYRLHLTRVLTMRGLTSLGR